MGQLRFSAEPKTTRNLKPKQNDPKSNCLSNFGIGQLHGCEPKVIFGTATHRLKRWQGPTLCWTTGGLCENHGARCENSQPSGNEDFITWDHFQGYSLRSCGFAAQGEELTSCYRLHRLPGYRWLHLSKAPLFFLRTPITQLGLLGDGAQHVEFHKRCPMSCGPENCHLCQYQSVSKIGHLRYFAPSACHWFEC